MTEARETELIRIAATLRCNGQIAGFRKQLRDAGETITGALEAALIRQTARVTA